MTQLEFCRVYDEQAIAHAHAGESTNIPGVGDHVYVPDERESSVYVYVKVAGRRFFYDEQGHLTTVRLSCYELLNEEELLSNRGRSGHQGGVPLNTALDFYRPSADALTLIPLFCCPRCASVLTVHQPDPELPDCLLATCDDCTSWYLTNSSGSELSPIR